MSLGELYLKTGKLKWYFQEVSHDVWDYDATTPAVLLDVADSSGRRNKAVVEAFRRWDSEVGAKKTK